LREYLLELWSSRLRLSQLVLHSVCRADTCLPSQMVIESGRLARATHGSPFRSRLQCAKDGLEDCVMKQTSSAISNVGTPHACRTRGLANTVLMQVQ
jgi:hypothetical protein